MYCSRKGSELSDLAKNIENEVKANVEDERVITIPAFGVWDYADRNKQIEDTYSKVQVSMMNDNLSFYAEEQMATQKLCRSLQH